MSGWRVRPKASPEDSIAMRVVVAMAVEVGLVAVISQGVLDDRTALLALVLAPLGYWVSYRRRHGSNVVIKALLARQLQDDDWRSTLAGDDRLAADDARSAPKSDIPLPRSRRCRASSHRSDRIRDCHVERWCHGMPRAQRRNSSVSWHLSEHRFRNFRGLSEQRNRTLQQ